MYVILFANSAKIVFPCCPLVFFVFFKLGFTPCKIEQPLQDMELQEKETQKN